MGSGVSSSVVSVAGDPTVIVNSCAAARGGFDESCTWIVTVYVPGAVGVP
jgi:hypothetical protein